MKSVFRTAYAILCLIKSPLVIKISSMKKIVFMGTPEIAVPSLKILCENAFDIPLVITQTDKPKGRGRALAFPAVKEYALKAGLNVYQPEKIKGNDEVIRKLCDIEPDFLAVAAYGKILPEEVLNIPKIAPVNVHFSLLPKYRGPAPVNWSIMAGDKETGVSTMLMDSGMDTGDILLTEKTPVGYKNAVELSEELAVTGARLLLETLNNFGVITPCPQDHDKATKAPMMTKETGLIDWNKPAEEIERMTRAFTPWPAAYSYFKEKVMKIFKSEAIAAAHNAKTGSVISIDKDGFCVACAGSILKVKELQLEGKKRMDAKSFMAGFKINAGDCFDIK